MDRCASFFTMFEAEEAGVTAIEYGLLAALIVVATIAGISATGDSVLAVYIRWTDAVLAVLNGP